MDLTQAELDRYVGGQFEVRNPGEEFVLRGEIATISVRGTGPKAVIDLTFAWMARGLGQPATPHRWENTGMLEFTADLMHYRVWDKQGNRISLTSPRDGETVLLQARAGKLVNPATVPWL